MSYLNASAWFTRAIFIHVFSCCLSSAVALTTSKPLRFFPRSAFSRTRWRETRSDKLRLRAKSDAYKSCDVRLMSLSGGDGSRRVNADAVVTADTIATWRVGALWVIDLVCSDIEFPLVCLAAGRYSLLVRRHRGRQIRSHRRSSRIRLGQDRARRGGIRQPSPVQLRVFRRRRLHRRQQAPARVAQRRLGRRSSEYKALEWHFKRKHSSMECCDCYEWIQFQFYLVVLLPLSTIFSRDLRQMKGYQIRIYFPIQHSFAAKWDKEKENRKFNSDHMPFARRTKFIVTILV